jgi:uncharacterized membrane protein YccC
MLGRTIAWGAVVAALVLWLSGPVIPAWLLAVAVGAAFALGLPASVKQKRMERDIVRAWWRGVTTRT